LTPRKVVIAEAEEVKGKNKCKKNVKTEKRKEKDLDEMSLFQDIPAVDEYRLFCDRVLKTFAPCLKGQMQMIFFFRLENFAATGSCGVVALSVRNGFTSNAVQWLLQ
jgi:hypothetical protein